MNFDNRMVREISLENLYKLITYRLLVLFYSYITQLVVIQMQSTDERSGY